MLEIKEVVIETKVNLYAKNIAFNKNEPVHLLLEESTDKVFACVNELDTYAGPSDTGFSVVNMAQTNFTLNQIVDSSGGKFQYKKIENKQDVSISIAKGEAVEWFMLYTFDSSTNEIVAAAEFIRIS